MHRARPSSVPRPGLRPSPTGSNDRQNMPIWPGLEPSWRNHVRHGIANGKTALSLDPVTGPEHPPHDRETYEQERGRHCGADPNIHVSDLEEAPAKAADQIDHRIE